MGKRDGKKIKGHNIDRVTNLPVPARKKGRRKRKMDKGTLEGQALGQYQLNKIHTK